MSFRFKKEDREVSLRNVVLTIIFWALTLAWILLIFILSSIPVNEVAGLTNMLTSTLNGDCASIFLRLTGQCSARSAIFSSFRS